MPHQRTSHGRDAERSCTTGPVPGRKGLDTSGTLGGGVSVVTTVPKQVGHLIVSRCKALKVPRRFEPAHDLLSDPDRLVRILRLVVQPLVLPVIEFEPQIPVRYRAASQRVCDEHTGGPTGRGLRRVNFAVPWRLVHQMAGD